MAEKYQYFFDRLDDVDDNYTSAAIIYVDEDDIPEVILKYHSDADLTSDAYYMMLTVNESGVDSQEVHGGTEFYYSPNKNAVLSSHLILHADGYTDYQVYSIEKNRWKEVFKGYSIAPESGVEYCIEDEEVSEKEFENMLRSFINENEREKVDFKYTIDDIKKELTKYTEIEEP